MSKLTKEQTKRHKEACKLLEKPDLNYDEKVFVLENWHEGATHINSASGAYFTPLGLARDLSIYVTDGDLIDLCAGIGTLAFSSIDHFNHHSNQRIVCIESNSDYVEVGKKIVPEAEWICCSVFDYDLVEMFGTFDCAISNPPFGRDKNSSISGVTLDLNVVAIASRLARRGVFILPRESVPFKYSGSDHYQITESRKYQQMVDAGVDLRFYCSSVDCGCYKNDWNGVSPSVELVYFDLDEQDNNPPYELNTLDQKDNNHSRVIKEQIKPKLQGYRKKTADHIPITTDDTDYLDV